MTASNAAPLNGPSAPCGELVVVVVDVGGVDVDDVDAVVDDGCGSVAEGVAAVVDLADVSVETVEPIVAGVAAVPSGEVGANAYASTAAPATPITQ